ncbi:MAG: hypothetical protein Q7K44_04750 [Candidatus Liptonbacteria bacterium]|nr:hypothetical protein [Candidatus Liptonbacteria bacterium]
MTISTQYAKALYELVSKNSKEGNKYLKNLRQALEHRGHVKLLPQIFSEYKKLALANERKELHKKITPENERTRTLLELYRKLTTNIE